MHRSSKLRFESLNPLTPDGMESDFSFSAPNRLIGIGFIRFTTRLIGNRIQYFFESRPPLIVLHKP